MYRRARPLAVVAATGLLVSACGSDDAAPAAAPAVSSPAPVASAAPAGTAAPVAGTTPATAPAAPAATTAPGTDAAVAAPEALQFTAPLVGGGEIDLAAGYGGQPVLFWFWAPY